ncbi:hypothetical protein B6D52_01670 [Candidatus Parcubacteria bacterium 4484_255]|nr:MAG: hypothetical protein B6D52_01670 [Candidatus Parcubacteria bacterium 4484_255]
MLETKLIYKIMKKISIITLLFLAVLVSGCIKKAPDVKNFEEISIIAPYNYSIVGMCSQNCEEVSIGPYRLTEPIKNLGELFVSNEIVWALGELVEVKELPRVAGPVFEGVQQENPNKKLVVNKLKINDYKKIDFFKFLISSEELSNYLNYRDAKFDIEFSNPLEEELKIKIRIDRRNEFQDLVLGPMETKRVQYVYKGDIVNTYRNDKDKIIKRRPDDTLPLVILNDFIDYDYVRQYVYQRNDPKINDFKQYLEARYGSINQTLILIYQYHIELENCQKIK